ncbi:MAG: hypothetical protein R3C59_21570 [Planctomycetaceae bacterium]
MNPYFYAAIIGAASASEKKRNGHKSSTATQRRVVIRPRRQPTRTTLGRERRTLFTRTAIIAALMIACIIGITLFWLA